MERIIDDIDLLHMMYIPSLYAIFLEMNIQNYQLQDFGANRRASVFCFLRPMPIVHLRYALSCNQCSFWFKIKLGLSQ